MPKQGLPLPLPDRLRRSRPNLLRSERLAGLLIREARLRAFLTQEQLGALMGVSQGDVSRWETGRVQPSVDAFLRAVGATGHDLDVTLLPGPVRTTGEAARVTVQSPIKTRDQFIEAARLARARKSLAKFRRRKQLTKGPHV